MYSCQVPNQNSQVSIARPGVIPYVRWFARYPVPDNVEMGSDHGNCWLLRHCNSWEVLNKNIKTAKRWAFIYSTNSAQVCQACVSGPAGETDVDNCIWKFIPRFSRWIIFHLQTCENSSFTLRFPVDSGRSWCHKSKLRQVWNVQRSFLCTEQHPSRPLGVPWPSPPWRSFDQI